MARTRADLEAQIADDFARGSTDLATQITTAVNWAIQYYQDDRFFFNERSNMTVTMSSSVNFVPLTVPPMPFKIQKFDRIRLLQPSASGANAYYYEILPTDYDTVMAYQDQNVFSRPIRYTLYGDQLQFDVGADQNYTLVCDGIINLGAGDTATYVAASEADWFNVGAELIRSAAKRNLYNHVIKDERMAAMAVEAEQDAYSMLKGMTNRKKSTGIIKPRWF